MAICNPYYQTATPNYNGTGSYPLSYQNVITCIQSIDAATR